MTATISIPTQTTAARRNTGGQHWHGIDSAGRSWFGTAYWGTIGQRPTDNVWAAAKELTTAQIDSLIGAITAGPTAGIITPVAVPGTSRPMFTDVGPVTSSAGHGLSLDVLAAVCADVDTKNRRKTNRPSDLVWGREAHASIRITSTGKGAWAVWHYGTYTTREYKSVVTWSPIGMLMSTRLDGWAGVAVELEEVAA